MTYIQCKTFKTFKRSFIKLINSRMIKDSHLVNMSSSISRFFLQMILQSSHSLSFSASFASIFFLIFSCIFFRLLGLDLLPDLLLHLGAIISMSLPVRSLAFFVAVARLKQKLVYKFGDRGVLFVTFLHPAHLLFARLETSAWQNQQMLSALSSTRTLVSTLS